MQSGFANKCFRTSFVVAEGMWGHPDDILKLIGINVNSRKVSAEVQEGKCFKCCCSLWGEAWCSRNQQRRRGRKGSSRRDSCHHQWTSRIHHIEVAVMLISQPVTAAGCIWRKNRMSKTSLLVTWTYQVPTSSKHLLTFFMFYVLPQVN